MKKPAPHYAWLIAALSVSVVLGALGFGRFGYTMILPSMKTGLGLTDAGAGDIATANMLGYLILSVMSGFLASRYGPRIVITGALFIVAAAMAATGLSRSYLAAFIFRLITGIGSGGANIPVIGLLAAWFTKTRRGFVSGIAVSGSSFGLLITGLLVPPVVVRFGDTGWRAAWYLLAGITALIALFCGLFLRNRPAELGLHPFGPERAHSKPELEEKPKEPEKLHWSRVYKSKILWWLSITYVMFGFSYVIYATFFARALVADAGFSQVDAGALWSTIGGLSIASGFIWGGISDKLGRMPTLVLIYLIQGASFAIFGIWHAPVGYYLSSGLFALTAWSIPAVISAAAADNVGPRLAPLAFGFMTLFFGIGQVIGPFVAGRIADRTGTFAGAFILAAAAAGLGSVMSAIGGRTGKTLLFNRKPGR